LSLRQVCMWLEPAVVRCVAFAACLKCLEQVCRNIRSCAQTGTGWVAVVLYATVSLSRPAACLTFQLAETPWIILLIDILSTLSDIQANCDTRRSGSFPCFVKSVGKQS
jgi:hypothetical protein